MTDTHVATGFEHLRELPDGSLTKAEVGILLTEIERLRGAVRDLAEKSEQADIHDCCASDAGDFEQPDVGVCDCSACTAGIAWRSSYVAALDLLGRD